MFKDSFKYYKSRSQIVDFSQVLDLNKDTPKLKKIDIKSETYFGFNPTHTWEVFEVVARPGLIIIKNPFTNVGQRYWAVRCLQDYSKRPYKRNIDSVKSTADIDDWWQACNDTGDVELLKKLRWSTLGYHHNWDTKYYSEEHKTEFPEDLQNVTKFLSGVLNFGNYSAEAAIINYYHMDSTLSGHTDHSEPNLNAPLFSFSFGQTAVFLIGGKLKEDSAIPMFLRSGDILVMSGDSRLCYHGVPRIINADSRPWESIMHIKDEDMLKGYENILKICKDEKLWTCFGDYLTHSRINMNVRQVLNKDQESL